MRKTLVLILLGTIGLLNSVVASCPLKRTFSYQQSDGTYLTLQKEGNGRFAFYSTSDGMAVLRKNNGDFVYVTAAENGLRATEKRAHNLSQRSAEELSWLAGKGLSVAKAYSWMSDLTVSTKKMRGNTSRDINGLGRLGEPGPGIVKSIGNPLIPVVMIEFPDRQFMTETTPEKVNRMLNEKGYADEKYCKGSVKDYFTAQSNGLFSPSFQVVAKVKASHPYAYYGENYSNGRIDKNVRVLIQEALELATAQGADFNKFTKDAGRIPLVSVYYAGPGEHSSFEEGSEDYIWAHFSQTSFNVGGNGFNSYFVGNEVLQNYKPDEYGNPVVESQAIDGIGIFCHEFGHALGLPDFYKTSQSDEDFVTPDYWSVMDYGQYFYDGYAPIGYSAFERSSLGWLRIKELKELQYAYLYPFGQEDKGETAYVLTNSQNPKEYFILENRQPDVWYPKLMGHGMLITHVDYDASIWASNRVNNDKNHQRYEIIPADNVKSGYEWVDHREKVVWDYFKADLFPGLTGAAEFTDESVPSSTLCSGASLNKPIYNIKDEDGIVSFSFLDRYINGIQSVDTGMEEGAEVYTLSGQRVIVEGTLLPGIYIVRQGDGVKKVLIK